MNLHILSLLIFGAIGTCLANFLSDVKNGVICIRTRAEENKISSSSEKRSFAWIYSKYRREEENFSWKCWSAMDDKIIDNKLWARNSYVPMMKALRLKIKQLQKLQESLIKRRKLPEPNPSSSPPKKGHGQINRNDQAGRAHASGGGHPPAFAGGPTPRPPIANRAPQDSKWLRHHVHPYPPQTPPPQKK